MKTILQKGSFFILLVVLAGCVSVQNAPVDVDQTQQQVENVNQNQDDAVKVNENSENVVAQDGKIEYYEVSRVVDGDTLDVKINGTVTRVRFIGIDTPETVDPSKSVECFGKEASNKAHELMDGKKVALESDKTQEDKDKYNRLLRYVRLEDGLFINLEMIRQGFAHEYTYNLAYKYQSEFKEAEKYARENKLGLWADGICDSPAPSSAASQLTPVETKDSVAPTIPAVITEEPVSPAVPVGQCVIKGNINSKGEKIFHVLGCGSYNQTGMDESAGERWFCSDAEAISAGWRKAKNCP